MTTSTDVIVVGKGPAGLSAAIYMARAGLRVTVLGKDTGALERAHLIENYYGFAEPVSGETLQQNGERQAARFGVAILPEEVTSVMKEEAFFVKTSEATYTAKAVLLATGKPRQGLRIKGFEEARGKGVSFCAVCDGFFYRNKRIGVIGSGEYAAEELVELLHFSGAVTLFTNGEPLTTAKIPEGTPIVTDKITEILLGDNGLVSGIVTEAGVYALDGIFVAVGTASAADFALKIGVLLDGNSIVVDADYRTNVEGLYAAGDCIGGYLQVAKAVADGALASRRIIPYVRGLK